MHCMKKVDIVCIVYAEYTVDIRQQYEDIMFPQWKHKIYIIIPLNCHGVVLFLLYSYCKQFKNLVSIIY